MTILGSIRVTIMKIPIFSKRHYKSLKAGNLSLNIDSATKQRIYYALEANNCLTWHSDISGFNSESDLISDTGHTLCAEHGWPHLKSFIPGKDKMQEVQAGAFIKYGAPHYILDFIELYSRNITPDKYDFQQRINDIFRDSQLPWILVDDLIFKIDSEYMSEVLANTSHLLSTQGFEGALQEFQMSRAHYESKDFKGAIHHANQSFESTIKSILGVDKEKPGKLIRMMIDSNMVPAYYDEFLRNFEHMLRSVNIARNEEAGHGQGAKIKEVEPELAELVINICASLIIFLMNHYIKRSKNTNVENSIVDEDVPF